MSLSLSTSSSSLPQAFDLNITNASLNSYPSSSPSTTLQANLSAAMMLIPLVLGGTLLSADVGFSQSIPEQAQVIDQKALNVLETVEPPSVVNLTNVSTKIYSFIRGHGFNQAPISRSFFPQGCLCKMLRPNHFMYTMMAFMTFWDQIRH